MSSKKRFSVYAEVSSESDVTGEVFLRGTLRIYGADRNAHDALVAWTITISFISSAYPHTENGRDTNRLRLATVRDCSYGEKKLIDVRDGYDVEAWGAIDIRIEPNGSSGAFWDIQLVKNAAAYLERLHRLAVKHNLRALHRNDELAILLDALKLDRAVQVSGFYGEPVTAVAETYQHLT